MKSHLLYIVVVSVIVIVVVVVVGKIGGRSKIFFQLFVSTIDLVVVYSLQHRITDLILVPGLCSYTLFLAKINSFVYHPPCLQQFTH